jgi:sRNA-binding protein
VPLCERFPEVFCLPRVPLAIGIHRQIRAPLGNEVTTRPLSAILAWWTKQPDYLEALARGEMRRNLNGSPAVEPNEVARPPAYRCVCISYR